MTVDKNGVEIKAGDTIFNQHDEAGFHEVIADGLGNLFIGDFDSPIERYSPQEFWERVLS